MRKAATVNRARLAELFGGAQRFALLSALYVDPARRFAPRELVRITGSDSGNVSRWLNRWAALGLVTKMVEGRNVLFQAAADPLLAGLSELFRRNDEILRDIAAALPAEVESAAVFGSTARGQERALSDIDVLALGEGLSDIRLNAALRPVGRRHRREIHVTSFARAEFDALLQEGNSFARSVVEQPVIPIKGEFAYGR
jgi:hypothetical protein